MVADHTHADHPWHPGAGIERRLAELSEIYPCSILLALDDAGRAFLEAALKNQQGDILWTDNGGGDLSDKHWGVVTSHIGYAEAILWFTTPSDAGLVRAACADVARMSGGDG